MLCLRCMRSAFEVTPLLCVVKPSTTLNISRLQQQRPLSILSGIKSRPSIPATFRPTTEDAPISSFQPLVQPALSLLQIRGAKRDTYNPSHIVRKRRHGFLARLRTRTGRMILKRRKLKGRNTLSH